MFRELKIVITILFIFLIFGLNSWFANGGFVTPFLFSKFILVITSLIFLLLNWRIKGVLWLFWSVLAYISLAISDEFSVGYFDSLLDGQNLNKISSSSGTIYLTFFLFYGFLLAQIFPFHMIYRKKWATSVLSALFLFQFVVLFLGFDFISYVVLSGYLLFYFLISSKLSGDEKNVVDVISAQSFALFFLELFKYAV